jgi:hypothetical protein
MNSRDSDPPEEEGDSLRLNIVIPMCCVTSLAVSGSALVGSIRGRFPGRCFIYKGEHLEENRAFSSYGMQSTEPIVAVACDWPRSVAQHWAEITRNSDGFYDTIRGVMNRATRLEALRMHDVRALRLETRPRHYRRYVNSSSPLKAADLSKLGQSATVIPRPAERPSIEPLPFAW